ncbi:MAG: mycofactocin biosynthesis glycosyltransferase MftF [Actinobacteria bacterium]|nr:mycofactocin biosynthesis glycosyltransferase MftF [Actinomycetota bacterium]
MSAPRRFELDAAVRRRDGGRLLVGGMPSRLLRLSEAGAAALDALLATADPNPAPRRRPFVREALRDRPLVREALHDRPFVPEADERATAAEGMATLTRRLELHGLIHPLPGDGAEDPAVTTVIPVLDGGERLADLVAILAAEGPVIVVDDGSRDGSAERAARAGARVIRHDAPRGPAAARNAGLRAATTDLVAFLDADCAITAGWRAGLAGLLAADPDLAVVAPRVRGLPGPTALARYERGNSPLDLGAAPSLVGPGRRVSYLPAAALLARRTALLDLGGFDEAMRFGEDVDLIWRLLAAGHRARYVPAREVLHAPRPDLRSFARQRFGYGASAPDLAARHGALAAPLRLGPHAVAVWGAAALLGPRGALAALAGSSALVASRGGTGPARLALAEAALRGQAAAARHLLRTLAREWLPAALVLATVDRRARRLLTAAVAFEIAAAAHRTPTPTSLTRTAPLRLLDHASYAAGLWTESLRRRESRALRPAAPLSSRAHRPPR